MLKHETINGVDIFEADKTEDLFRLPYGVMKWFGSFFVNESHDDMDFPTNYIVLRLKNEKWRCVRGIKDILDEIDVIMLHHIFFKSKNDAIDFSKSSNCTNKSIVLNNGNS